DPNEITVGLTLTPSQVADPVLQKTFGLGEITIPSNCVLMLAIQQLPPGRDNGLTWIHVQYIKPVWDMLDDDTKAALIVHELFYEEYILREITPKNAVNVRALNGLLGTDDFALHIDTNAWNNILRANNFTPMFPQFYYFNGLLDGTFYAAL